jgi:hypothetical protein
MDAYYQQQSQTPYFSGHVRQRGSGIGALVAGVGRVALPFIRRVILPAAKRIGRELFSQALPQAIEVIAKRKTPKQALKQAISNTVRKQIGGGTRRRRRRSARIQKKPTKTTTTRKRKSVIPAKGSAKRSRVSFFSNVHDDY